VTESYNGVKDRHDANKQEFNELKEAIGEAQLTAEALSEDVAANEAALEANDGLLADAQAAVDSLEADVANVRSTLVLFCHQFVWTAEIPAECQAVFEAAELSALIAPVYVL